MSVVGGGNLYPNWLGSASLTIPNNQAIVNGKVVNIVPNIFLTNQSIASVTANTKTLVYTMPGTYDAGIYFINAEFQVQNTGAGQTAYAGGDGVDWIVQGIGDPATDYAEGTTQPFYTCVVPSTSTGSASSVGVCRITPSGITQITSNGTQMGIYVRYLRTTPGTITATFTVATMSIQKVG